MPLRLRFYGDPILRKKCAPVESITPEIVSLIEEMVEAMDAYKGIGLAAPQVGRLLQIFVVRKEIQSPDGTISLGEAKAYINPKISNPDPKSTEMLEGCLSVPGLQVHVKRPIAIDVEYMDIQGTMQKERLVDFPARVIMHENDHLHGRLHLDRAGKKEKDRWEKELRALKKKYKHTY